MSAIKELKDPDLLKKIPIGSFEWFKPFLLCTVLWLVGSLLLVGIRSLWDARALISLFFIWMLCVVNLLALGRFLKALFTYTVNDDPKLKPSLFLQMFIYGSIKLGCIGLLIMVLLAGISVPNMSLLLGLGTMVFAPLAGGFWWSRKELVSHA